MRVGVTGAGGLLGTTLVPLWRRAGEDVIAWTLEDFDVTDAEAARRAITDARLEVVVHAAAYTAVDRAESEPDVAMRVNRDGTVNVCRACAEVGARLVYISTDYVFDGAAHAPIAPDTEPSPQGAYARSKAEGERAVRSAARVWLIVRTGWLYGPGGPNFVDTMRVAAAERRQVAVVNDQYGAPTSTRLVSEGVLLLARRAVIGMWHLTAAGVTSWHDVARTVFDAAGAPAELVTPCSTEEAARPAPRPRYSVLDSGGTATMLGVELPAWEKQVTEYVRTGRQSGLGILKAADA